ncbi:MAG: hypothetical protein ACRC68_13265 [Clostridium sp.]
MQVGSVYFDLYAGCILGRWLHFGAEMKTQYKAILIGAFIAWVVSLPLMAFAVACFVFSFVGFFVIDEKSYCHKRRNPVKCSLSSGDNLPATI